MQLSQHTQQLQTLSPVLQQALQTLQLPLIALDSHLQQLAERNPMLEYVPPLQPPPTTVRAIPSGHRHRNSDYNDARTQSEPLSFSQMLLNQLNESTHIPSDLLPLCRFLVESLDRRGYLCDPLEELSQELSIPLSTLERALTQVQQLTPPGVGARSLEECLRLQLETKGQLDNDMDKLLCHDLSPLAQGNFAQLAKDCNLSRNKLSRLVTRLQVLTPYPSQCYHTDDVTNYVFPEATIHQEDGIFSPLFHRESTPSLTLHPYYLQLLESSTQEDVIQFLRPLHTEAQTLFRHLAHRHTTVEEIVCYLVSHQQGYFHRGDASLAPLTVQQVADALSLHPSTIRRGIKNKHILTSRGMIPLSHLLSAPSTEGADSSSRTAICARIAALIADEDCAHPLSDAALQGHLAKEGIPLSRRTVTKYRESLHLPNSTLRRR